MLVDRLRLEVYDPQQSRAASPFTNRTPQLEKNRCFNAQRDFVFFLRRAKRCPSPASCFISGPSVTPAGDWLVASGPPSLAPFAALPPSHAPPVRRRAPPRSGPAPAASEGPATTCWEPPALVRRREWEGGGPLPFGPVAPKLRASARGPLPIAGSGRATKPVAARLYRGSQVAKPAPCTITSSRAPHPGRASTASVPASSTRTSDPPRLFGAPAQTPTKGEGATSWTHPKQTDATATAATTTQRVPESPPSFSPLSLHQKPAPPHQPLAHRTTCPASHWLSSILRPRR